MGDLADVYDEERRRLSEFVAGLDEEGLARRVPATPDWTMKELMAHVFGVAAATATGSAVPTDLLNAWRDPAGAADLNEWTTGHVAARTDLTIDEILNEWEMHTQELTAMMRGERPWRREIPYIDRILITDAAAHTHDSYGAFGIVRDREAPPVKIGLSTYIGGVDIRLRMIGSPALRFDAIDRDWVVGGGDPAATVRAGRFELFRALSGRRSPDQVRAFQWEGDAEPFLEFFYPYGVRPGTLVE